ncbi:hypothetical protein [Psychrobacter sp. FDAARGOS_221]|uniref:hypothetical protein n=1 Tax=Psychrobacter sp. FDAARGOS_221 TaxID=1975705 RepID=UPI000BB55144|nr:hypothetical protein [Psychrobacter sp. FDAARGOS_221]PNK61330.1 hypothetical protein A6J60_010950 [Psychrobacter sp. FDAARGOS_221]
MKNIASAASLVITAALLATSAQAAEPTTKLVFAKGSYCGSFSGDLKRGKRFSLWLLANQEVIIRNTGYSKIKVAYIDSPNGRVKGEHFDNMTSFYTTKRGNHYIKIYGSDHHSSVEICAY